MEPVSFGVLGASSFALAHTARAIHEAEGARLAALATSSPAKAEPFRAFAPDLRVHESYDALLADPAIEAVYIPLPNHLHVEWTLKALEAGKHVLCEKPIAMRADQIDALIEARDRTGLFASEAYMIVHHPQWQLVRRLLDEGAIGAVRHVDTVQTFDVGADADNIRNRAETGGGSVPDVGVYTYGSVRFAARAEPVELTSRIRRENGVEVWAHAMGTMAGATGEFTFASTTSTRLPDRQEAVFQGEDGMIRVTVPCNAGVVGEAQVHLVRGDVTLVERFPSARQYVLQVQNMVATVRTGAPYPWSLEDARGNQAMIDMVLANEV
ncbi:Gfo/Idh/MocA family oxidoreductase [Isoptericola sp. b441]|uniref:Gfo/Idh/MocA family oxidoreductase n=1 Tax=Actinotalea lenta TaxID=3064654 RepID=A0ABT9D5E1_9CELL|nr:MULTISPECIES: Gfo/Idh/MocA family oxidoreductase [unclassified Isoptericola]MDO8105995.1 Gfo/Idh/MocA family oxidoreductase [Isoptericola sp. b441]MDO8122286.1 Gfo/Idh/MocA family oxidoreductase [Isoptericola sp. b490]